MKILRGQIKLGFVFALALMGTLGVVGKKLYELSSPYKNNMSVNEDAPGEAYFTNMELETHEGEKVKFFDDLIKDKVVLINFIYTSCGSSCPLETARLKKVAAILDDRMGKDVFFYSLSIDPENDTVDSLKSYHERFGIGKGWLFLRGEKEKVGEIQKKFGMYNGELVKSNFNQHALSVMIGNQTTGKWIKRSHLENPTVLANLLENMLEKQEKRVVLKKYDSAPTHLRGISRGENLFYSRCVDCHSIGNGDGIGPDLINVTKRRDPKWLNRWLKESDKMLEEKDSLAIELFNKYNKVPMPNLRLSDVDVEALIEFIDLESKSIEESKKNEKRN